LEHCAAHARAFVHGFARTTFNFIAHWDNFGGDCHGGMGVLDTRYVIKEHFLLYRSGPFRGRIDIAKSKKSSIFLECLYQ
jgi:hypothetical protein